jgi:hypothetical protein
MEIAADGGALAQAKLLAGARGEALRREIPESFAPQSPDQTDFANAVWSRPKCRRFANRHWFSDRSQKLPLANGISSGIEYLSGQNAREDM